MLGLDGSILFGAILVVVFFLVLLMFTNWTYALIFLVGIISFSILWYLLGNSTCNISNNTL